MPKSHCPINFALEIFGDKWTLLIIRDMLFVGKKYYGDFINSEEGISTNILADRLNLLEREGFVQKNDDEAHGAKYVYKPTQKAIDLIPMLLEMILWSAKYDPATAAPKAFIARLKKDKKVVISDFLAAIRKTIRIPPSGRTKQVAKELSQRLGKPTAAGNQRIQAIDRKMPTLAPAVSGAAGQG